MDLVVQALPHEVQLLAKIGQAFRQGVQLGGAVTGFVRAAPLRSGFEELVQPGHRAKVVRECLVEQPGELLGMDGGKAVDPVAGRCRGARAQARGGASPRSLGGLVAVRLTTLRNSLRL
ncbi:hypothetical protein [Streptomyces sp. NPDC052179]|uniref:hypothetical protein n=1 Tax=Streptomyces sp. NPDC052179 TaxID=3155680 RepID=UPI003425073B